MISTDINNKVKKGYKQTKLGWIPEEWHIKPLGDLSIIKGDYGINAAAVAFSPDLPLYLRITDINENGSLNHENRKSVDNIKSDEFYLDIGDIVFARTGATVGKTYLHNDKNERLVFAGFLIRFRTDKHKLLPDYLKFYTETNYYNNWVRTFSMRSGQPGINSKEYCKLPIPLPPLPEQQKIASILNTWNKAIALQEKLIGQKQELKNGLMQQLLTGKKRFPGFTEEWKTSKLRELLELLTDFEANGSFADVKANVTISDEQDYAWYVRATDLEKETDLEFVKYVDKHSYDFLKKTTLNGDELLVTKRGEIGKVYFFNKVNVKATLAPNLYLLKLNNNVNAKFLYYLLKSYEGFKLLNSINASTTMGALYKEDVKNLKLVIPTTEEQGKIVSTFNELDKDLSHQVQKLKELEKQKQGLMQQLLTGKTRVNG